MIGVLLTKGNLDTETDVHRGKMMWRGAGRRWPSPSQGERPRTDSSLIALRKNQLCCDSNFGHLLSRTEAINFCCLREPTCGSFFMKQITEDCRPVKRTNEGLNQGGTGWRERIWKIFWKENWQTVVTSWICGVNIVIKMNLDFSPGSLPPHLFESEP